MKFKVRYEEFAFYKFSLRLLLDNKGILFFLFIGIIQLSYLLVGLITMNLNGFNFEIYTILLYMPAILLILSPGVVYFENKRNFKKVSWYNEEINFEIKDDTLKASSPTMEQTIKLESLEKIKEYKNWIAFFTNKNQGYFIPKLTFKKEEELSKFRDLIAPYC